METLSSANPSEGERNITVTCNVGKFEPLGASKEDGWNGPSYQLNNKICTFGKALDRFEKILICLARNETWKNWPAIRFSPKQLKIKRIADQI